MATQYTASECGHQVSRKGVKKCRACYYQRGPDTTRQKVTHIASECGHTASRADARLCKACFDNRGSNAAELKQYTAKICGHPCSKGDWDYCRSCYLAFGGKEQASRTVTVSVDDPLHKAILASIKSNGPQDVQAIGQRVGASPGGALDALLEMQARGINLHKLGDRWSLERQVPVSERVFTYTSRPDNTYVFGEASDAHLCSKYAREDVLGDLYDRFERSKVDRVFNAGNWIDGEDERNRFDLTVHGLEPQIKYLTERFPQREGITTYAIAGEDHEGWYSRREAIDVGRFAEAEMRRAGRQDWVDLGFIEARIDLVNANTGKIATLVVMHPGGGSSYAYSYRSQKIVESFSGGEKPSVLIIGHYHKLNCNIIRNVWTIQAGCTEDQTVFMRKKGLEAHVGGMILTLEQDPDTGAVFRCVADQMIYYDRSYKNDRWSKTRNVVQAPRYLGGVQEIG